MDPLTDALPHDVVTMGRVGVDLYPELAGVGLADAPGFRKMLGGSPTNVAVAAARLGLRSAVVTKVGDDAFGEFVVAALRGFGVDPRWVEVHPTLRTPLAFCELHPPDHFPLLFYRDPTAPDLTLTPSEVDDPSIIAARLFWTTGTGLSREPSRSTTLGALEARARRGPTVHDLDHRPDLWEDPAEATRWARAATRHATIVIGNRDEVEMAVGPTDTPEQAAQALLDGGAELAIVKLGPQGVLAMTADERVSLSAHPVRVVNGLGAGDAFGGMLCRGILDAWPLRETVDLANTAGAIVAGRLGCSDAMPSFLEVDEARTSAGLVP